jgi:hypothetical protein
LLSGRDNPCRDFGCSHHQVRAHYRLITLDQRFFNVTPTPAQCMCSRKLSPGPDWL